MESALNLVSIAAGFGAAWLARRQLEPWRKAAWVKGGPSWRRAERIYVVALIGSFFAGIVVTKLIIIWLG
jgi:hypothetical protein